MIAAENFTPGQLVTGGVVYNWVANALNVDPACKGINKIWESLSTQEYRLSSALTDQDAYEFILVREGSVYWLELHENGGFDIYCIGPAVDALKLSLHSGMFPGITSPEVRGKLLVALKAAIDYYLRDSHFVVDLTESGPHDKTNSATFSVGWWQGYKPMDELMRTALDDALLDVRNDVRGLGGFSL